MQTPPYRPHYRPAKKTGPKPRPIPEAKVCPGCGRLLSRIDFAANKARWDLLQSTCRSCARQARKPRGEPKTRRKPYSKVRGRPKSPVHGPLPRFQRANKKAPIQSRDGEGKLTFSPVGEGILDYLLNTTLSQTEIAKRCDVSRETVNRVWRRVAKTLKWTRYMARNESLNYLIQRAGIVPRRPAPRRLGH